MLDVHLTDVDTTYRLALRNGVLTTRMWRRRTPC